MNKDGLIYTIIFSFVVTFLFVVLLAAANIGTADIVAENNKLTESKAILGALGISYNADDKDDIFAKYESVEKVSLEDGGLIYYIAESGDETIYGLQTSGPGLWGTITVVIGFNADVSRYLGIEIIDQNETPGLGGRITEDWYREQFVSQAIPASIFSGGNITLSSGDGADDKDDNAIDAITGATRTSESMQAIVSQAARDMKSILGGN